MRDFSVSDNPNPQADIGFVVFYPFQFYVLKDIYKHLEGRSEFIIDLGAFFPVRQPESLLLATVGLLQSHKVKYRILWYSQYYSSENLEDFFSRYRGLVAMWERGCLTRAATKSIKKICATYGVGKELTMVRPSRGLYDLILAYGPRDQRLFSYYTESKIPGNPKFDDWFNGVVDERLVSAIRTKLDRDKKTVLYLPTHSDLSSVDVVADEFGKLRKKYNIIAKMHYFLAHEEPERVELLRKNGLILYGDETDILPLFKVADVVVSDNSSAIFDAMLADKPVVVADLLRAEYLDGEHKKQRRYRRGVNTALTFSGSIEQEIKRDGRVLTFSSPTELDARIVEALQDTVFYREARKRLVVELFAHNDGQCGKRAADMIIKCISETAPKSRPILYHAIEAYKNRIEIASYAYKREMESKLENYQHRLSELAKEKGVLPIVSTIVLDTDEGLLETLSAVTWQKYPIDAYEVIILSSHPKIGDACPYVSGRSLVRPGVAIKFHFYSEKSVLSDCLASAIEHSSAEWVGFTRSGCAPASDWLLDYVLRIRSFGPIAGIGGYEVLMPEISKNRFLRYEQYLAAKKIGTHTGLRRYSWATTVVNSFPSSNPFGALSNSFYRREVLLEIDIVKFQTQSWSVIEALLRWMASKYGQLAFVPVGVRRFSGLSYRSFRKSSFDKGFAHGLVRRSESRIFGRFSPDEGMQEIIREVLAVVSGRYARRSFDLAVTALQGSYFRLIGFLVARYRGLVELQGRNSR